MLYRDLVNFEPIDSVIQLRDADAEADARRLVETYVISDRMASQIAGVVIPQLQIDVPQDNKGILIVGNYGTGKSHLMSVLSALAEYPDTNGVVMNEKVRDAASRVAGRFQVIRIEIGSVETSFRDIIVGEIEEAFEGWGIDYSFPPANELTNNKDAIISAVATFQEKFPGQGLLLVVDEMLDYFRGRNEQALILDLGFLRELGEVAELTPFRFIGGLQETLFDSPRFSFVAEQLRRVRDRFEQVLIAREDIAYVVSNRILKKTNKQIARITDHLREFAPLYGQMAERMDDYARLFPIHPSYLDTFQNVAVAEKREVLKTFSQAVDRLLDKEVPTDQPGLISFDHYWGMLQQNPSMRTYPEVSEVLDKGQVLERRVKSGFTRKALTPMALRIVHALGVHRLTTGDINAPLGLTPEELKDNLCLFVPTPERTAEFLLGQVRVALKEIIRTVSGQYISYNDVNDQYYLDVKKDIDFDAKIDERGAMLSEDELNRFFFDGLREALGFDVATYVSSHRIWFYELPWNDHKVTRPGYFFFGAPDERSTAQPPRDFYIFLLPPFLDREWADAGSPDEVIFRLEGLDAEFEDRLRTYAGARALEGESASHRGVYGAKAADHRRRLLAWVTEHLVEHLHVRYHGHSRLAREILPRAASTASSSLEDLMRIVASTLLTPHFNDLYPDYPCFTRLAQPVTEGTRATNAQEAIRAIATGRQTAMTRAVLDALGLLENDTTIAADGSMYAQALLERLKAKEDQQVVNRGEVVSPVAGGVDRPVEKDLVHGLEPEWIAVLLIALVHHGDITLTVSAREKLDAGNVERASLIAVDDIAHFQHYGRPKQVPLRTWTTIFEGLGLQTALIRDETKREQAVEALVEKVPAELKRVVTLENELASGFKVWNDNLFNDNFRIVSEGAAVVGIENEGELLTTTDSRSALREYKAFLQELQKFNTPGKLRNLTLSDVDIRNAIKAKAVVHRVEELLVHVQHIQPLSTYLVAARAGMDDEHPWSEAADTAKQTLLDDLRRFGRGEANASPESTLIRMLEDLKARYIADYDALHRDDVLGGAEDDRRQRIYNDGRLKALEELYKVDLLGKTELTGWKKAITAIPTCKVFHPGIIETTPICECGYKPVTRRSSTPAKNTLAFLDNRLSELLVNARQALRDALESDASRKSLANMTAEERAPVDAFLAQADDDPDVPAGFAKAATTALRGLEALPISVSDLLAALETGGLPCTVEDFRKRFADFVNGAMRGKDAQGTRITIERTVDEILAAAD